jgi:hypothetical protein
VPTVAREWKGGPVLRTSGGPGLTTLLTASERWKMKDMGQLSGSGMYELNTHFDIAD